MKKYISILMVFGLFASGMPVMAKSAASTKQAHIAPAPILKTTKGSVKGLKSPTSIFQVTTPNGGEVFTQGGDNTINWQGGTTNVYVGLVDASTTNNDNPIGNPYHLIGWLTTTGTPDGSLNWDANQVCDMGNLSCWAIAPGQYKILIATEDPTNLNNIDFSIPNSAYWDVSDAPFTISAACNPSITVTSPNGGEVYTAGDTITINWTSCGLNSNDTFDIYLVNNAQHSCKISR